jgi:rRNA maturation endonuclease Nob1
MQQLDAGSGYREQIEKDLAKRLGATADDARLPPSREPRSGERVCAACETENDADARFCKSCGQPLAGQVARG